MDKFLLTVIIVNYYSSKETMTVEEETFISNFLLKVTDFLRTTVRWTRFIVSVVQNETVIANSELLTD